MTGVRSRPLCGIMFTLPSGYIPTVCLVHQSETARRAPVKDVRVAGGRYIDLYFVIVACVTKTINHVIDVAVEYADYILPRPVTCSILIEGEPVIRACLVRNAIGPFATSDSFAGWAGRRATHCSPA